LTRIPLSQVPGASIGRTFAGDVCWSPDGSRLVFLLAVRTSTSDFQEGIATASADGTDVRWVTTSPTFDNQPDWGTHPPA
jgi:Tol biopolymer transport system component